MKDNWLELLLLMFNSRTLFFVKDRVVVRIRIAKDISIWAARILARKGSTHNFITSIMINVFLTTNYVFVSFVLFSELVDDTFGWRS